MRTAPVKRLLASMLCVASVAARAQQNATWSFAVSGDSRNCGDIIMPQIAAKATAANAAFYWHLGDFRALYDFDQDMLAAHQGKLTVEDYRNGAWQDFIDQQLAPFGSMPVFLALGNHELVSKTRPDLLLQFADWFDTPAIRAQRLADNPADHLLRPYFHWHKSNVDFITLDNASPEQFDDRQVAWFEATLKRDAADPATRTVVLGMHDALPDSLTSGHSMNESTVGTASGRRVYDDLLAFRKTTGKEVQVLASHSHFVLEGPYRTSCRKPEDVLPGWIIGAAGAVRYRLPADHAASTFAQTDVYGFLLATVTLEGHITFAFKDVAEPEVSPTTTSHYGSTLVHQCFAENKSTYTPTGPVCPAAPPPR